MVEENENEVAKPDPIDFHPKKYFFSDKILNLVMNI